MRAITDRRINLKIYYMRFIDRLFNKKKYDDDFHLLLKNKYFNRFMRKTEHITIGYNEFNFFNIRNFF